MVGDLLGYYKNGMWRPSKTKGEIGGLLGRQWPPRTPHHSFAYYPREIDLGILPGKMKTLYVLYLLHKHPELTPKEVHQELEAIEKTGKSIYLKNEP